MLSADPSGKDLKVFATGIRNCVSMAVQPVSNALWCVTNERDLLGDNLPPDYATTVKPGAFYGWPWYYIGAHEDPRPHLKGGKVAELLLLDIVDVAEGKDVGEAHDTQVGLHLQ